MIPCVVADPQLLTRLVPRDRGGRRCACSGRTVHFFRNAYVLDFDPLLVKGHAERLVLVHKSIAQEVAAFLAHLDPAVKSLARSA